MYPLQKNKIIFSNSTQLAKKTEQVSLEVKGMKKVCYKLVSILLIIQLLISTLFGYGNYATKTFIPDCFSHSFQQIVEPHVSDIHFVSLSNNKTKGLQRIIATHPEDGREIEEDLKKRLQVVLQTITSIFHNASYWIEVTTYSWLFNWEVPCPHLPCYMRYCSLKIPS